MGRPEANGTRYGFRIEFPEAVQGPVAVGYAAHFGMGGFEVTVTDHNNTSIDMIRSGGHNYS